MYAYFIDDWVNRKRRRTLDALELLLTQHGVSGRAIRLSRLSDIAADIGGCAHSGIKGMVAVGDDATASRVLNQCLLLQKREKFSFVFGVIPIAEPCEVARLFGIESIQAAVRALASSQTRKLDAGMLNERHYFLTAAVFPRECVLAFRSYSVSSLYRDHHISICNADIYRTDSSRGRCAPDDGVLEAVIAYRPRPSFWGRVLSRAASEAYVPESFFPIKKIHIKSKQKTVSVAADIKKQLTAPVVAEVLPGAIEAIVAPGSKR